VSKPRRRKEAVCVRELSSYDDAGNVPARNDNLLPVTPEETIEPLIHAGAVEVLAENQRISTAGMTTKVVKGSMWTLAGQVLPMFASLVTAPIIIRLLGAESYGVLILVGIIPNYFSFADFGMGMASTKFASEAYSRGDRAAEADAVRTAAFIAFLAASAIALPILMFASTIIAELNVPDALKPTATLALRFTSLTFIVAILSNVFNTPQLSRLRMDINAAVNAAGKIVGAAGSAVVLYLGGGIAGAAAYLFFVSALGLGAHIMVSGHLLRDIYHIRIDRRLLKPLLRFGSGLMIAGIAAIFLINIEKLLVTRLISVESLAFYSIAFTFANMAAMFSWSMVQSLIPAFSQLLSPEKRSQFDSLFSRGIRLSIIWLLPTLMVLFVIAKPFFTIWAGAEFGRQSPGPFYVLLIGLLFNVVAYVPYSALVASSRTGLIAKIHSAELIPYAIAAAVLISYFGIVGAALAWSLRVVFDSGLFLWLARSVIGVHTEFRRTAMASLVGLLVLSPSVFIAAFYNNYSPLLIITAPASLALYSFVVWRYFVTDDERHWFVDKLPVQFRSLALRFTN